MLTQKVIKKIKHLISRMTVLEEKINLLPTKDEVFSKIDQIIGELQSMREERRYKRIIDLEENRGVHFTATA